MRSKVIKSWAAAAVFLVGTVSGAFANGALYVNVDIKQKSCENPLNVFKKGVLPVVILGSAEFDVTRIDLATIELGLCDVAADSVVPKLAKIDDVGGGEVDCSEMAADGYDDVVLKFESLALAAVLGEVADGDDVTLCLTALADSGMEAIVGTDTVRIIKKVKAPK